jgi:hypothetical protein
MEIRIAVIWIMMPCSLVGGYQHFRRMFFLHLLKIGFICSPEVLVRTHNTTQHHNPDYRNPYVQLWFALNSKINLSSQSRHD